MNILLTGFGGGIDITNNKTESNSKINYQVRALSRALKILSLFNVERPELSLNEISELTGFNKSTVIRLLHVLIEEGFIEQNPGSKKYTLGIKTFEIGSIYNLCHLRVNQVARVFMYELSNDVNLTSNLAILDQGDVLYIGIETPQNQMIRLNISIGARIDFHCTALGKVLLSQLPSNLVSKLLADKGDLDKKTNNTITDQEELKAHLKQVYEQGYALDDEEVIEGIRCIAAPIYDYSGKCIAALSISGIVFEVTDERIPVLVEKLKNTTQNISESMGYRIRL